MTVNPARAGMIRWATAGACAPSRKPRASGDDPIHAVDPQEIGL